MAAYGDATTNGGTIVSVPAGGYAWEGYLVLSASLSGAIGASSVVARPSVTVSSTGDSDPDTGTVVARLTLSNPAIAALSLVGTAAVDSIVVPDVRFQSGPDQAASLVLNYNSATAASCVAVGEFV